MRTREASRIGKALNRLRWKNRTPGEISVEMTKLAKAGWANMTPLERRIEMRRRMGKAKRRKKAAGRKAKAAVAAAGGDGAES